MKKLLFLVLLNIASLSYASEWILQLSGHTDQDIEQAQTLNVGIFPEKDSLKSYQNNTQELYYQNKDILLLVKKDQVGVIGFCLFGKKEENILNIKWLIIAKEFQKKGIGSTILNYLELMFIPNEMVVVTVTDAVPFYEKNGFNLEEGQHREDILISMKKIF